jgi:membrane protein
MQAASTPVSGPSKPATSPEKKDATKMGYVAMLKQTGADWSEDNCMRLSAALSGYTVMSLAPLVVIIFKILSIVFRGPAAQAKLQKYLSGQVQSLTGFKDDGLINTIIQKSTHPGTGIIATSIGIAVLLFSASGVFGELQNSMNTIWEVKPRPHLGVRGYVRQRFLSMTMVLGVAFLLLVSLFVSTAITAVTKDVLGNIKVVSVIGDIIVSLAVVTVLFAMIFKLLPDVRIPWKYVWLGALITAVLFTGGKWGLTAYFKFGAPTSAYGAFGSLAAVVLWVYYSAMIMFAGAEFTKVYARAHGHKLEPTNYAVPLTEEARAQQGIPHEQTIVQAAARENAQKSDRVLPVYSPNGGSTPHTIIAAGAAFALGALGAWGFANTTKNRIRSQAQAARLGDRLHELERRARHGRHLREDLANEKLVERVHAVEARIRHAACKARRAQRHGQETWTHRALSAVKSYVG